MASIARRAYELLRGNWRIAMLVVLVLIATYFLFVPGATIGDPGIDDDAGLTNIRFGIDLAGGARVTTPVHGFTAEEVGLESPEEAAEVERQVSEALGVEEGTVRARPDGDTVEVYEPGVNRSAFSTALDDAGYDPETFSIREGVTAATRSSMVDVLTQRIDAAGFSGSTVRTETTAGGESFIVVESPGRGLDELREIIGDRGEVQLVAHYPTDDGHEETVALDREDIGSIGTVEFNEDRQRYETSITVASGSVDSFIDTMQETGFDEPDGWGACSYPTEFDEEGPPQDPPDDGWGHCFLIVQDGQILNGYGVDGNLGEQFAGTDPQFGTNPTFVISVPDASEAEQVRINLQEGALPAQPNLDEATTMLMTPVLAEQFLQNSLLTGLLAVIAVVLTVFVRYGDPRVAVPMSVTALAEVYLLLGFAGAIGMALNLAHVAGFIAVVGTGVDDLIIIADEVLGETDVRSRRVFDSRFRKAFWVIGAAAATTIVAMSPLIALRLGDLFGFAVVTILGVLIGVFITRPAYGNILRLLKTDT
ncbi:MAG: preprotein translocase subunit SecD [Halobacteriota archaeon]